MNVRNNKLNVKRQEREHMSTEIMYLFIMF